VTIRRATISDEQVLRELWEEFETEVPEPGGFQPETWEEEWAQLQEAMATGCVLLAEDDEGTVGMLEARRADAGRWHIETVQVKQRARRRGVATALLRDCSRAARAAGASNVSLDVLVSNTLGETVWRRLGFEPVALTLAQPLDQLDGHLDNAPAGPSRASTHVQTDDRPAVERAVAQFVPRLDAVDVHDADGGWIRIADPLFDSDRDAQARFARDLSDRLGAVVVALALERGTVVRFRLYERGRMVDEYLSVPDFYAQLDRGDELAMEANPTLVARLTGADRDEVRRVARTATSSAELPPAETMYEEVARMMGLEP
jgi:ribosomal protein S18 acetylase RimI-like enzyme